MCKQVSNAYPVRLGAQGHAHAGTDQHPPALVLLADSHPLRSLVPNPVRHRQAASKLTLDPEATGLCSR